MHTIQIQNLKSWIVEIYFGLLLLVICGKISNWFINSDLLHQVLNTSMFSLIGLGYIQMARSIEKYNFKTVTALSGIYLIIMNFIEIPYGTHIGIVCIILPMLIKRYTRKNLVQTS